MLVCVYKLYLKRGMSQIINIVGARSISACRIACVIAQLWNLVLRGIPNYLNKKWKEAISKYVVEMVNTLTRYHIYRMSQEEWTKLRESVPYVKLYLYNPKHLHPKLNGYGDNGHRKVWASGVSTYCTPSVTP